MKYKYKSTQTVTDLLRSFLLFTIITKSAHIMLSIQQLIKCKKLNVDEVCLADINPHESFLVYLSQCSVLIWWLTFITLFVWMYKTTKNARAIKGDNYGHAPCWSFLGFIIPFVNLFMPYKICKNILQSTECDQNNSSPTNALHKGLVLTYILYLLGVAVSYVLCIILWKHYNSYQEVLNAYADGYFVKNCMIALLISECITAAINVAIAIYLRYFISYVSAKHQKTVDIPKPTPEPQKVDTTNPLEGFGWPEHPIRQSK